MTGVSTFLKLAFFSGLLGLSGCAAASGVDLVGDGRIETSVVVCGSVYEEREDFLHEAYVIRRFSREVRRARDDDKQEMHWVDLAIEEIEEHLKLVAEGEMEVRTADFDEIDGVIEEVLSGGGSVIAFFGPDSASDLYNALADETDALEGFLLEAEGQLVSLAGNSPKAFYNAALELLEHVGFRWYMPGDFGRVVPDSDTLSVAEGRVIDRPSFAMRTGLYRFPQWARRQRNAPRAASYSSGHGISPLSSGAARRGHFEEDDAHQDHFRLRDGERAPGQLCLSHPEVLKLVVDYWREELRENEEAWRAYDGRLVIGMGPNDGSGWCECADCKALDRDDKTSFTNRENVSGRYMWFYKQVLNELEDEFPDLHTSTAIYADQMDPPIDVVPHERQTGGIIAIHTCRKHSMTNPRCPEAQYREWLIKEWQELLGKENVRYSNYYFHLACPGFPFIMVGRDREELPRVHELGVRSLGGHPGVNWANEGPSLYVAGRLMWDVTTDVDALLDDFFEKFYGPAAAPMERYIMGLDQALHSSDFHGGAAVDLRHIYDVDVRRMARESLVEARELAGGDNMYATRVEVASKGWEYFEAYVDMVEKRNSHDYEGSMAALERAERLLTELTEDYEIPMIRGLQRRFFNSNRYRGRTVEGYKRVTDGNELVVGLDQEWDFLIEPQGIGERMNYQAADLAGGNWRKISTDKTWSYYGLRYYWGEAWYRQTVEIPEEHEGRDLKIWFAGLTSSGAKVFVNGKEVGVSRGAEFDIDVHSGSGLPFDLDITGAVRFGEPNVVAVRVVRDAMHEIGKGGLAGPVMIYAPAAR